MNAEIVSIGTELLLGQIVDTNAAVMGNLFAELGIQHVHRQTVGDNRERLESALRLALSRADVVVTIGGLGPTGDDITREAIAASLDDSLTEDADAVQHLKDFFASRGRNWTERQLRQAQRPTCGEMVSNPNGTAPGLLCQKGGKILIALPGPKGEFVPMAHGPVREFLARAGGSGTIHSRTVRVSGLGESAAEARLGELMESDMPTVAPYAKVAEVHFRVTARAETVEAAEALIAPMIEKMRARLGDTVYGFDDTTLEQSVIELLASKGQTLAVAESCTGGMLGQRITGVSGSSRVFLGGAITYSNELKMSLLGVSESTLAMHGAVSPECAAEMASGARERFGSTWALSVTGIAGPDGGTPEKPVGLVYVGLAGPNGVETLELKLRGLREDIRWRATQVALDKVRHAALKD